MQGVIHTEVVQVEYKIIRSKNKAQFECVANQSATVCYCLEKDLG